MDEEGKEEEGMRRRRKSRMRKRRRRWKKWVMMKGSGDTTSFPGSTINLNLNPASVNASRNNDCALSNFNTYGCNM